MPTPTTPTVTYYKTWDGNETSREGRNGRIYESVVGWVYIVEVAGHPPEEFKKLRHIKIRWPHAKRIPAP